MSSECDFWWCVNYIDEPDALVTAAYWGHSELLCDLLDNEVDPNVTNETGRTALMEAAYSGWLRGVEVLLSAGADVNMQDNCGDTALDLAIHNCYKDIIDVLESHGAVANYSSTGVSNTMSLYYDACEYANKVKLDAIKKAESKGSDE